MQKRHVLVCEGSLCPRTLSDVSGPGLREAGRYRMVSEPTLAVSRARTGVSAQALARSRGGRRCHRHVDRRVAGQCAGI